MRLNNTRLELIYNMIANENKQFNCFGDVGTDHAHLPIYLLQQGVCRTAIASDVNVLPLKRAEKNVRKAGYADKITLLLCDGLAKYNVACDVVCIAGLSGTTIISIIKDYLTRKWQKEPIFLLQPNTSICDLRRFLSDNGFFFKEEKVCIDKKHEYPVIKGFFCGTTNLNCSDVVSSHLGLLKDMNDCTTKDYLKIVCKKYKAVINKLTEVERSLTDREDSLLSEMKAVVEFIENKLII